MVIAFDRVDDFASFDPEAGGAARIVAGDIIDPLTEQLGDQQAAPHLLQQARQITLARMDDQVVTAAGVAGSLQSQLACAVGAEEITLQPSVADHLAVMGCHPVVVEMAARQTACQMRPLADAHFLRKHALAEAVDEKGGLAVQAATTHRMHEIADQRRGERCLEDDRHPAGADLARTESRQRAPRGEFADRLG
jgi:hypothetical protein